MARLWIGLYSPATKTIVVSIIFVNLSGPSNATIAHGQGRGTIINDD